MSRFSIHFKKQAEVLKAQFQQLRATLSDSSAKGTGNEQVVAAFLRQNLNQGLIATRCQVVDSDDQISGEIDVSICNEYQPFRTEAGGLLIAEGIDFVVQVKAVLSTDELERALQNCESIKRLNRKFGKGDEVYEPVGVRVNDFARIPFVILAFSSELTGVTVLNKITKACEMRDLSLQPDAIFVLDRGYTFRNFRDGTGNPWKTTKGPVKGWLGLETGEATLLELIRFSATSVPKFIRHRTPLWSYVDPKFTYPIIENDQITEIK